MMKFKRLSAIVLSLIVAASVFACGKSDSAPEPTNSADTGNDAASTVEESPDEPEVLPDEPEEEPYSLPDSSDLNVVYGKYTGELTFENVWGSDDKSLEEKVVNMTATCDYDKGTGRPYMELFVEDMDSAWGSMWIKDDITGNTLVPDFSSDDCWLNGTPLTPDDEAALTGAIKDGTILLHYEWKQPEGKFGYDLNMTLNKDTEAVMSGNTPAGMVVGEVPSSSSGSSGASGNAQTYAGWYVAVIPDGFEALFDNEASWENAGVGKGISVNISTNKTDEYVAELLADDPDRKALSDVTFGSRTWKAVAWKYFSDDFNSVTLYTDAVAGQMMSVEFEYSTIDDPIVAEFMNSFDIAPAAAQDPVKATNDWKASR